MNEPRQSSRVILLLAAALAIPVAGSDEVRGTPEHVVGENPYPFDTVERRAPERKAHRPAGQGRTQARVAHRGRSEYALLARCQQELKQASRIYARLGVPVFDTTSQSIEELAARLVKMI